MDIKVKKMKMTQVYDGEISTAVTPLAVLAGEFETLNPGDFIRVTGRTKGRGFQGVVKRHGFHGGPKSHGQKDRLRAPGSIGGGARAGGRVAKGMKMAGRMGGINVTILNLKLVNVDSDKKTLFVRGAVPGTIGTVLVLKKSTRK